MSVHFCENLVPGNFDRLNLFSFSDKPNVAAIVGGTLAVVLVIIGVYIGVLCYKKKKKVKF